MIEQKPNPDAGEVLTREEHQALTDYAAAIFDEAVGDRVKSLGVARALAMIMVDGATRGDNPVAIFASMLSDLALDAARIADVVLSDDTSEPKIN